VQVIEVPLDEDFNIDIREVLNNTDPFTKILFICSPNNPSGNLMDSKDIELFLQSFAGIVVLDEAYMDFSDKDSWTKRLLEFPNLVVLQTFSKAWGLAGLRIGMAFALEEIIAILNNIKPPYNINEATQQLALEALSGKTKVDDWVKEIINERELLGKSLKQFPFVENVYPSEANFLLVKVEDATRLYTFLTKEGIIVRNRHNVPGCENCLRITIGTAEENQILLNTLNNY
jgi:histidinol-phosphate aminotransferase